MPKAGPQGFAARESKNQIARKFDEIVEFSGCARYIDTPVTQAAGLLLVESYGSERRPLGRLPKAARRVNRDLGKVEKDCREAAPKEEQVGKTCESNERERANQPV